MLDDEFDVAFKLRYLIENLKYGFLITVFFSVYFIELLLVRCFITLGNLDALPHLQLLSLSAYWCA